MNPICFSRGIRIIIPLGRDLRGFFAAGYQLEKACCVDMFPETEHVETVCCLYHQKKDFISVPYEPKDDDYLKNR